MNIFISYRRADSGQAAGRLYDTLERKFRNIGESIFKDIDSIPDGVDFRDVVNSAIADADVFLCVIGKDYLNQINNDGTNRLFEENDNVRLELEAALTNPNISFIPILVDGAIMPITERLPETIQKIAYINAFKLRTESWGSDCEKLIKNLKERRKKLLYDKFKTFYLKVKFVIIPSLLVFFSFAIYSSWPYIQKIRSSLFEKQVLSPEPSIIYSPLDSMVLIQGDTFKMGDRTGIWNERPEHKVILNDFYIGRYEVTFEEFDEHSSAVGHVFPSNNGWGGGKRPVIHVNWYKALRYCNWLSEEKNLRKVYTFYENSDSIDVDWEANGYRLPTEAEWEFVARNRGKRETWVGTSNENQVALFSNYASDKDTFEFTAPVGTFIADSLGLFDMGGNVWEWCWDWYDEFYYRKQKEFTSHPKGPANGKTKIRRGGSFRDELDDLRCINRNGDYGPDGGGYNVGFRLARNVK